MGCLRAAAAITTALLTPALGIASAQQVSGTAHEADRVTPSAQTSILLIDQSGSVVAGALTTDAGRYSLKAPRPGVFRVRARRIGFAPDSSDLVVLKSGESTRFDPRLTRLATSLTAVSIRGSQRCVTKPGEGEVAFGLWQATLDALSGAVVSSLDAQMSFVLERFRREVNPATRKILSERVWEVRSLTSEPYVSLPPESLAVYGFARSSSDSSIFYAPDARTLTSDFFSATHCFRPTADPQHPDRVGLAFEPTGGERGVDVSGVLWLDRSSSRLLSLDYGYLSMAIRDSSIAGGQMAYSHLKNGASIVTDWVIRAPVLERDKQVRPYEGSDITDRPILRASAGTRIVSIWEIGGRVKSIVDERDLMRDASKAGVLRGSVISQGNHSGLANVRVELTDTVGSAKLRSVSTDADGSFKFEGLEPAKYVVTVPEPRFDTLNTPVLPITLRVDSAAEQTITITVADADAGRAALCRAVSPGSIVVHGVVRDSASRQPIPSARVNASWLADVQVSARGVSAAPHSLTTYTNNSGRYAFCSLEPTSRLLIRAELGSTQSPRYPSLTVRRGDIVLYNLSLERNGTR